MANDLYRGIEAIGTRLTITLAGREHTFWVVGVMEERGQIGFENLDNQVYIPLSTLQALTGLSYISAYVALAESETQVKEAVSAVEGLLDQIVYGTTQQVATTRQIPGGTNFLGVPTIRLPTMGGMRFRGGFSPYDVHAPSQIVQTFEETTATLTLVLGGIAAISLLVGGIGIMNIMLVSVVERTQEIGIRMAVGARPRDIWAQFLSEAVLICLLGGLLGLLIGWAAGWAGSQFGGWPFVFAPTPAGIAFGFSALVGLVFGFYPALRAARLAPVAALGRV